jgi:hypothetical protein
MKVMLKEFFTAGAQSIRQDALSFSGVSLRVISAPRR